MWGYVKDVDNEQSGTTDRYVDALSFIQLDVQRCFQNEVDA